MLPLALLLAAPGCKKSKREHCNALIDAVNPHTVVLGRAVENLADVQGDPAVIEALRTAAAEADAAVAPLSIPDARLAGFAKAYREQMQTAVGLADDLDAANGAPAKLQRAVSAADAFLARQDEILGELNDYCAAAP